MDASDPVGPAEVLFQKPFHKNVARCLNPGGIFVTQSESPFFHQKTVQGIQRNLREIFPVVRLYTANIPTYPSGFWSFSLCSDKVDPVAHFKESRVKKAGLTFKYYNAALHRGLLRPALLHAGRRRGHRPVSDAVRAQRGQYSAPRYYEIAFDMNRKQEVDFLVHAFRTYARRPIRTVLDIACGTGPHLIRLAERGYRMSGLDLSPENIDFLRQRAAGKELRRAGSTWAT